MLDKIKSNKILTPEERRTKTIEKLKKQGIEICENLPLSPSSENLKLKSTKELTTRALGSMLCIQLAC